MSTNYSRKEFILFLYCRLFPADFSEIIGEELKNIEIEKYMFSRKLDAYTKTIKGEVFFEAQLTQSDESHYMQISTIIDNIDIAKNSKIIWLASSFNTEYITKVNTLITKQQKNIEFIAVIISEETIEELGKLNSLGEFDLIGGITSLNNIGDKFLVINKFYRYHPLKEIDILSSNVVDRLDEKMEDNENDNIRRILMEKIVDEMRLQIRYYPAVHRSKRLNTNFIIVGGGKNDVRYEIGINKYNKMSTEIRFSLYTKEIFNRIYFDREQIDEYFDYRLEWDLDNLKITCNSSINNDVDRIIKHQVRMLDKYIRYFSAYVFNKDIEIGCEIEDE